MSLFSTNGVEIRREFNNNLTEVRLGKNLTFWFSYETIVAFAVSGEGSFKVRQGRYSQTTNKHTRSIAANVLDDTQFDARLQSLLSRINAALDSVNFVEVSSV